MTGPLVPRHRIKFHDFTFERLPDSRCRARVDLAWMDDRHFVGEAEGVTSPSGELRCAAQAAVEALVRSIASRDVSFELLGVKSVRAFDSTVVVVAIAVRDGRTHRRLVGSCIGDRDLPNSAAMAVLSATNRFLGNQFQTR